ncbi:MAG: toxin-activating lysine-acyltransferase [Pseudomonadota bacterium]
MNAIFRYANPTDGELQIYGTLCFLAGFDPYLKHKTGRELEDLLLTPSRLGLTWIYRDPTGKPLGALIFAYLDEEHEQRLFNDEALRGPRAWMSGNNLWVIAMMSPFIDGRKPAREFIVNGTGGLVFSYVRRDSIGALTHFVRCSPTAAGRYTMRRHKLSEGSREL